MENKTLQKNRKLIDYGIFLPALLIILIICIPFSLYESESLALLNSIFDKIVEVFSWGLYMVCLDFIGCRTLFIVFEIWKSSIRRPERKAFIYHV